MKISIVIPVYNEADSIEKIVAAVKRVDVGAEKEIVIVDDGSTDATRQKLEVVYKDDPQIKVFSHNKNQGKGAALKTAFGKVSGDIIIIQDADLEYDPEDYPYLLSPIINRDADVVYGTRLSGGRTVRVHMFWHKIGNNVLTLLTNILYNTTLTDMETGYKVFKRKIIQDIDIKSRDFTVEAEFTAKILKRNRYKVYETPISYYGRGYLEGKKIRWYHAISAIWALIKYKFID